MPKIVVFFCSFVSDEALRNQETLLKPYGSNYCAALWDFPLILYLGFYVWNNDCKPLDSRCVCQQLERIVILNTERE